MYGTLKKDEEGVFATQCPTCRARTRVDQDLTVLHACRHFVRRWRVTADGRVRAEFRTELAATR